MKKSMALTGCVAAFAFSASAFAAEDLKVQWKEGINFVSADKAFDIKIGGRVHHDWSFASADDDLKTSTGDNFADGTEMRRARLYVGGTMYKYIKFKAQYDFAGGDADFKDVYMTLKKLPFFDSFTVGQFIMPHGFEINTSSNYLTMMERSPVQAFMPDRHAGAMVHKSFMDKQFMAKAWVYRQSDAYGEDTDGGDDGEYNFGLKLEGDLFTFDEGLFHVGISWNRASPAGDSVRYRARPSAHISTRLVDTGAIAADTVDQIGFDANLLYNSFMLSGEFHQTLVGDVAGEDPVFTGFYLMGSYMLTGEQRAWKKGNFSRTKPKVNLYGGDDEKGFGAFELAARYSVIDLESESINGGEMTDLAFGVNWYLNPNTVIMLNFVHAEVDKANEGGADYLTLRFNFNF